MTPMISDRSTVSCPFVARASMDSVVAVTTERVANCPQMCSCACGSPGMIMGAFAAGDS